MLPSQFLVDQHAKAPMAIALPGDLVPASVTSSPRDVFQASREPSMLSSSRLVGERVGIITESYLLIDRSTGNQKHTLQTCTISMSLLYLLEQVNIALLIYDLFAEIGWTEHSAT